MISRRRFLGLAGLAASAPFVRSSAAAVAGPDEDKQVREIFGAFVKQGQPGGAVIVIQDGKELFKGAFGLADIEKRTPLTTRHMFHLASAGKQFTGVGIMMLFQEGKLKYDDAIGDYLSELSHFGSKMTIRSLLYHTSGIPDAYSGDLNDKLLSLNPSPTNKDVLAVLNDAPVERAPGLKYEYSNVGYDMLGSLIEKLSGKPFEVFMQERIFGPVGMRNTFSLPNPRRDNDPNIAHSYTRSNGKIVAFDSDPGDFTVGSGSIYTTVEDMALYDKALGGDSLVKQSTLAEAFKSGSLNNGTSVKYGFGWELDQFNGVPCITHDGSWLAFRTAYLKFPSQKLTVVMLLNRDYDIPDDDAYGVAFEVADVFLDY